ncbi:hypothetical protein ANN_06140 [Periplaneta americana]|uniref:Uncharacterized protein n=1 Tax=Periplaneta americana TaxID=6978 RepID=A0ABQ8TEH3_PERAM|nr:hypothetical protein ANN_06140 [Periplaneta americana]
MHIVLVGRPDGKRPLGRPRRRWEDNIKMDLREVVYDDREWINLAQDRDQWRAYVRVAMNLQVPQKPLSNHIDLGTLFDDARQNIIGDGKHALPDENNGTEVMINDIQEAAKLNLKCVFEEFIEEKRRHIKLRVFENKVLRKIFGAKRDEVTGEWRKLHNTELHALYSSLDIIRNVKSRCLRWAGHVARMGESRSAYRVLVGRPEGKRPLGRPRHRWEDIKMDLREVGYDDRDWINLAQDREQWRAYVRAAMNLRVP